MADNGDRTYSFNYSVVLDGEVTVVVKLDYKGVVKWKWYSNYSLTEPPTLTSTLSQVYFFNDGTSPTIIPGQIDYFTAKIYGKIKPPSTGSYTYYAYQDDAAQMSINGY